MKIGGFFAGLATGLLLTYFMLILLVFDLENSAVAWEPTLVFQAFQWFSLVGGLVSVVISAGTLTYDWWKKRGI